MTLLSYGASPATSLIKSRTKAVRLASVPFLLDGFTGAVYRG